MTTDPATRVLYIEDEQSLCDLFKLSVQSNGHSVSIANSGKEGLDVFGSEPFDVVVIDYQLPDMTGIDVGKQLLKENPDLPVLLVTGQGSEQLAIEAFSMGFSNYIVKDGASVYLELIPNVIQSLIKMVSEKKQRLEAETRLIEKDHQIRSIFENTPSGMITIDSTGIVEMANPAALQLFGYSEHELIGQSVAILAPSDVGDGQPSYLKKLLNNEDSNLLGTGNDVLRKRKDGTLVPVHLVLSEATVGQKVYFTAIFTDQTERIKAERTRSLLELGLDNIDEALALYDKNDILIYCNRQYTKNFKEEIWDDIKPGASFESILRRTVENGTYKISGTSEEHFIERLLELHNTSSAPYEVETSNGRWLSFRKFKTQDDGFVYLRQDITEQKLSHQKTRSLNEELEENVRLRTEELIKIIDEQKRVEEALRTSENRIRTIVESVNDGIITIDDENRIESFNSGAQNMFGYTLDEIIGTDFTDLIAAPEDQERRKDAREDNFDRRKDAASRAYQEIRGIQKGGQVFPIELNLNELSIGKSLRYVGTIKDLTERRAAEKERREIEARFRSVVDSSPSSILIRDQNDKLIIANRQWHAWFNPNQQDIKNLHLSDFFDAHHLNVMTKMAADVFALNKPVSFELEISLADRRIMSAFIQTFPILDPMGNVAAVGSMITDISERVKAEEERRLALAEAEKANRAKSDFLASMSHELRTPLNAILGFSEIISQQYMGPIEEPKYVSYANDIHASSEILLSLVNNILDLSAIEKGSEAIKKERVELTDFVTKFCRTYNQKIDQKGINFEFSLTPEQECNIVVDPIALTKILGNLLDNAVEATNKGGHVRLHAGLSENTLRVTISDTGKGIPEDLLELLKQPFVRGETDPHRAHGGAGLGLTIVQSLIDLHQGHLEIVSEKNKGTTMSVVLPTS